MRKSAWIMKTERRPGVFSQAGLATLAAGQAVIWFFAGWAAAEALRLYGL